jgi:Icc-related predicted phosphoesterase
LAAIEPCAVRIALLHYSPVEATLLGEPERLWLVLGAERLAGPIRQHRPQLVVHGHAHNGSFEGEVDGVAVYNVAVHVIGREFWVFELDSEQGAAARPLAVEES